jgi:hypothetical protein
MNPHKHKIGWTVAIIGIGWAFFLLPSAEDLPDAEPATRTDWTVWLLINLLAIGLIHHWWSEPARQERDIRRRAARQRMINERRRKERERRNHPTSR